MGLVNVDVELTSDGRFACGLTSFGLLALGTVRVLELLEDRRRIFARFSKALFTVEVGCQLFQPSSLLVLGVEPVRAPFVSKFVAVTTSGVAERRL